MRFAQFNINIWSRKGAGWGIRFWFSRPMFCECVHRGLLAHSPSYYSNGKLLVSFFEWK
jgi:hypothetical protein